MNIAIIGTGYVGLPTGASLAELGHNVICIDNDNDKIDKLKNGKLTIFESNLEQIYKKNRENGLLKFSSSFNELDKYEIIFITVGTPSDPITKEADLKYLYSTAEEIANKVKKYKIIIIKSTVPVGTGDIIEKIINKLNPYLQFDLVSIPEFLREGYAVDDFFNPDRIIIGTKSDKIYDICKNIYSNLISKPKIIKVDRRSAELIKYASNSFLAIKIHFINEISDLCAKIGGDINYVSKGIGLDSRIGEKFLNPGPGFGGSCFPKDILALSCISKQNNIDLSLVNTTIKYNNIRIKKMADIILNYSKDLMFKKLSILGLAFKNGTDDCRNSPSIDIINFIDSNNIKCHVFDCLANKNAKKILNKRIKIFDDVYKCIKNTDCIVVLTESVFFKNLDFDLITKLINNKFIIDMRNIINKNSALKYGFICKNIGIDF
jgi:UDPglucose 6-dehydrogenase